MAAVTIVEEGSGYKIEWADKGLECQVKHITNNGYKAQCAFTLWGTPVHRSFPTLNSNSGMESLARTLNRKRPIEDFEINWLDIVEDLAGILIDTVAQGKPEVVLGEVETEEGLVYRVDNLLVEGEHNLIWADGGTGKSMFALFLSVLVQQGYINSEHGLIVEPGNVLYLDWETKDKEIATRSRMIHNGLGMDSLHSNIVYQEMFRDLMSDADRIKDLCYKHSIDMIVVDSLGMACGGALEDSGTIINFFNTLGKFDTTNLVLSHSNRQGQMFGSAYAWNASRNIWEAKKTVGKTGVIDFTLFHRKHNNIPQQPAQTWSMKFDDGIVEYSRGDVFMTDLKGELSYPDLIFKILQNEGAKTKDNLVDEITSLKADPPDRIKRNIDVAITRLKNDDKIVTNPEGQIELVTLASNQPALGDDEQWNNTTRI